MSVTSQSSGGDPIWTALRAETWSEQERDAYLRQYLTTIILKSKRLEESLGMILAARLKTECLIPELLHSLVNQAFAQPGAGETESDGYLVPFLFMRGFQALQCYRVSHWLWKQGRELLAYHLQSRTSEVFGADIHPAARIGAGIMMAHATGIVIGRSVIGDDVTIGAGSIIASNLEIGSGARIAPGSAVMESVLPNTLVSGVPAVHQTDDDRATLIL
jgi:serine O-acetyltransferase